MYLDNLGDLIRMIEMEFARAIIDRGDVHIDFSVQTAHAPQPTTPITPISQNIHIKQTEQTKETGAVKVPKTPRESFIYNIKYLMDLAKATPIERKTVDVLIKRFLDDIR